MASVKVVVLRRIVVAICDSVFTATSR